MINHQIQTYINAKKGFALWSNPNSNEIHLILDENQGDFSFVMAPFDIQNGKTFSYSSSSVVNVKPEDLNGIFIPKFKIEKQNSEDKSNYTANFKEFVQELKSESETEKLVLARTISQKIEKNAFEVFLDLNKSFKENFVYLFFDGKDSFWTAATPETLIKEESSIIETMALAGTKIEDDEGKLNWTSKEYEEHQLVVDYINQEFTDFGLTLNYPNQPLEIKAGFVWHLKTPMTATTKNMDILDLAKHLHPTPAVCGTPKQKAKSFILEYENIEREYYCGFVGPISKSKSHLFVNLRCAKIKSDIMTVYVGGGLLKESDLESEWMETINKSKTILSVL